MIETLTHLSLASVMIIGSVVLFGVAVFVLVRTLYPESLLREMGQRASEAREAAPDARAPGYVPRPPPGPIRAWGNAIVEKIGTYNEPLVRPAFRQKMLRYFVALGRPEYRPQDIIAHQWIWATFFTLLGLSVMNVLRQPLLFSVLFLAFGAVVPYIWLSDQIKKRQRLIARAMPYNIDLLTLSVEAGLDFQAAMSTVVERGQPGPLIEELNITLNEIRLGKTRAEALRSFADRVQMPDVSAFVSNLIQADRMGTSLGKVLRIQANQMRINRTHRAEKLANEAPVKMLLPLIGCIFPTVFLILLGPIVYQLITGGG